MLELLLFVTIFCIIVALIYNNYRNQLHTKQLTTEIANSLEKTNTAFYEQTAYIVIEHFKQMERQSDKANALFDNNVDKLLTLVEVMRKEQTEKVVEAERIVRIDQLQQEKNQIEKAEESDDPLAELSPVDFRSVKNIEFEGEETVYPIEVR